MSAEVKHTPGPWAVWNEHYSVFAGNITSNKPFSISGGIQVCECEPPDGFETDDYYDEEDERDDGVLIRQEARANAQLISAAPDLLEALQELTNLMELVRTKDYEPDSFTCDPARSALAKALGVSVSELQLGPVSDEDDA